MRAADRRRGGGIRKARRPGSARTAGGTRTGRSAGRHDRVRPTIFRRGRLHPIPSETVNGIPTSAESMAGLVDDATLARIASEPDRPSDGFRV